MKTPAISLRAALALMLVIGLLSFYAGEWQWRKPRRVESSPAEFVRKLEERRFHGQRMRMQVAEACSRLDATGAAGVVVGLARSPVTDGSVDALSVSDPELAAELVACALMRLAALIRRAPSSFSKAMSPGKRLICPVCLWGIGI